MKIIIAFFALLFYTVGNAQSNYKIGYGFVGHKKTDLLQKYSLLYINGQSYFYKDNLLETNSRITKTYTTSENGLQSKVADSSYNISSLTDSNEMKKAIAKKKKIGPGNTVTKDIINEKIYFTAYSNYFKDTTNVKDSFNNFKWTLINNKNKIILNKKCNMAITEWRGRNFIAWYCTDIPVFDGPYKFCGLPGLILEVYDIDDDYRYTCLGINNLNENIKIEIPTKYIQFKDFETNFKNNYKKVLEIISAKSSINSDCTSCNESNTKTMKINPGIEKSLFQNL